MNKIRYWKRIGEYCNIIYHCSKTEGVMTRAYNMCLEIYDYIDNLEEN